MIAERRQQAVCRTPRVANAIFYPALMWTPQFVALSGDPFDPSLGFQFPPPENVIFGEPTRLATQGSLPSIELVEMAGFTGITETPDAFGPRRFPFDDDQGQPLPPPTRRVSTIAPSRLPWTPGSTRFPRTSSSSARFSTAAARCLPVASPSACGGVRSPSFRRASPRPRVIHWTRKEGSSCLTTPRCCSKKSSP
jgi:hypothetical protein